MLPIVERRRARLAAVAAVQASRPPGRAGDSRMEIAALEAFPVREPVSRRAYTLLRLRTERGVTGWGECTAAPAAALEEARRVLIGQPLTAYEVLGTRLIAGGAARPLAGGINMALLDLAGKTAGAPVYHILGGPTRRMARALAPVAGASDADLAEACDRARNDGFRAFSVPVPPRAARNQGQAFSAAIRRRFESLRQALGPDVDFVLDGRGALTAGDASTVAGDLERFHLLWFDEPCPLENLAAVRKIGAERVTPLGFGRSLRSAGEMADLLREEVVDVVRPDVSLHGIAAIRKMAAMAETYYVAVAPRHQGGPVATAAALHLAAALPNFFIQEVPLPEAEADRAMRRAIVREPIEAPANGFLQLPAGAGLGVTVDEAALAAHRERA